MSQRGNQRTEESSVSSQEQPTADEDHLEHAERLDVLEAENARLRSAYAQTRQTNYRRTALGLGAIGVVAVTGGLLFPSMRSVLFILGSIGLFGGVLTYYLTPERFIAAGTGERIFRPLAANEAALIEELGLSDIRVYVPGSETTSPRLFVPQQESYTIPTVSSLESTFVIDSESGTRGLSLLPSGRDLFQEFERTLTGSLASSPEELATQLSDGLIEGFELADSATSDIEPGRCSMQITSPAYGGPNDFDTPISSFVAVGFATGLERPVRVETTATENGFTVTCYWDIEETAN